MPKCFERNLQHETHFLHFETNNYIETISYFEAKQCAILQS